MFKTAFIFPGQGAQYVGMGLDFLEQDPKLERTLTEFDSKNNTELGKIIKDGPEEILKETKFTQPAILFHSIAALKAFQEKSKLKPDYVAGHSLGEFTALVASGVLDLADAMHLVHKRGEFMIKANEGKSYAMAAIIGLTSQQVREICKEASKKDVVIAANFNTPVQTVISGSEPGVKTACKLAKSAGAKRIVPLVVGGAFHSPQIERAKIWLAEEMNKIHFSYTGIPIVSNVDAKPVTETEKIKNNLADQVISPVLWVDSINNLINLGVKLFLEFGPKKVLAGMLRKIDKGINVLSLEKLSELEEVISEVEKLNEA